MKVFFALLLLTNIAFALIQWLFPLDHWQQKERPIATAEKLKLISELEVIVKPVVPKEVSAAIPDYPEVPMPIVDVVKSELCFTLGPFVDQSLAQTVAHEFKQNNAAIKSRSSLEKEYMGLMVYIDDHKSRTDAIKTAESLKDKGVRDYIIVNEPGKSNVLSLGVFGLKRYADRRVSKIEALGYKVRSEARYRTRTIYWLDYKDTGSPDMDQFITTFKKQNGISKISRQCDL